MSSTFTSCDHVEFAFPPTIELDTNLYTDGNWADYVENEWPDFDTISADPLRNAIIEDFTGHNCTGCPAAAVVAHGLHEANPSRVYVASIHAGADVDGVTDFQALNIPLGYTVDFMNSQGTGIGGHFFGIPNSGFFGNPAGSVNRLLIDPEYFYASGNWSGKVDEVTASTLKVALKAHVNYYDASKGFYLHTEVEKLDGSLTYDNLGMVAYMIEDSLVAPQLDAGTFVPDYVHRDIMRGTLSGQVLGRDIISGTFDEANDKYYLDYSYVVPDQLAPQGQPTTYNVANMHLLVYVYDKTTLEIYQVIKKDIE